MKTRYSLPLDQNAGWLLCLPVPRVGDRVLCIELNGMRNAESLSYWFDRVTALTTLPEVGTILTEHSGAECSAERVSAWTPGDVLPFEDGLFSAVVCRLVGGELDLVAPAVVMQRLLRECVRVLRDSGAVYLDVRNPWSYDRLLSASRKPRRHTHRHTSLERALTIAGLTHVSAFGLLLERDRVSEILVPGACRPAHYSWQAREFWKARLLRGPGSRWFAPAHAIVAGRMPHPQTLLSSLGRAPDAVAGGSRGASSVQRVRVNAEKTFVHFARSDAVPANHLCVVPTSERTVARRRTELEALRRLRAQGFSINTLLPRTPVELAHCERPIFVLEAIEGITVDTPVADLDGLILRAFDLLVAFDRESMRSEPVTEADFAVILGNPLSAIARRHPGAKEAALRLCAAAHHRLMGRLVPFVWLHGDYKLENLIFDARSRHVRGIIDWELSASRGLPFVDLLYLLSYRHVTSARESDVLEVCEQTILPDRWQPHERALLRRYSAELGLTPDLLGFGIAAFVAHHAGVRFGYATDDADIERRIATILDELTARMAAFDESVVAA